jgi:hypothetical protein
VNIKRFAVVSLLLATGPGLAAACGTSSQPGSAASTAPAPVSPADALTNALATLKNTGYDATLTLPAQGVTVKTSVDYANQAATQAVYIGDQTLSEVFTEIGSDLWVKADFGPLADNLNIDKSKWYKFDPSKLTAGANPFDFFGGDRPHPTRPLAWPLGIGAVFASVANVTRTDATHLAGVVDFTKATGSEAPGKSGMTDAAVPFTVTLDDQGRPTELKITWTNVDPKLGITFSNYGSPTPITAPAAADVLPAPDGLYQALNAVSG